MIYWTIFLGAIASLVSFLPGFFARKWAEVGLRFLERGHKMSAQELARWVEAVPDRARTYAFPVLFPFDLVFLICLGGFLALGSLQAAQAMQWPDIARWALAILPGVYVIADLFEDVMLARFLLAPQTINDDAVARTKMITAAKMVSCALAILQTAGVALFAIVTARGA